VAEQATDEMHDEAATAPAPEPKPHCGIIMPISDSAGYDPGHWLEVRRLIVRAAEQVGYTAGMVSENDGQDVIHRSIVKNIYHNDLVVCDVSSLNPNVMLELGLRMANKKPLIVIFDGEGVYPFDIKNMLYIPYPKGLHHFKVENFVQELTARMVQVTEAAKIGKYEPFLNHFNDVVIEESKLGTTTQNMAETLASLVDEVKSMKAEIKPFSVNRNLPIKKGTIKSNIFNLEEIWLMHGIANSMVEIYKSFDKEALVGVTYENLISLVNNKLSDVYNPNLAEKLGAYHKTAKNIILDLLKGLSPDSIAYE
jgi:hypothetical protein